MVANAPVFSMKGVFDPNAPAPAGYIGGVGRGATGFTTRSDIGPARTAADAPEEGVDKEARDRRFRKRPREGEEEDDEDGGDVTKPADDVVGFVNPMFATARYDEDDKAADAVYAAVDAHMAERRAKQKAAAEKAESEKLASVRPRIQAQFADLKADLGAVAVDEWAAIPAIGDRSLRYKQRAEERLTAAPDTLLADRMRANDVSTTVVEAGGDGTETTDLTKVGEARGAMLGVKLDRRADSVSGQTVVDPKGYLTDMKSVKVTSDAEVSDIRRAQKLLKNVRTTNPKHAPSWISAARLEEIAGRLTSARRIINEGCQACAESEDVWLEAARLHTPANAKAVLARAVRHVPRSTKIWLRASALETGAAAKKAVLRRALELMPNSVRLWKAAVELEEKEDARVLLGRAVECVPHSADMWLALAHLEEYTRAKQVLNKARQAIPGEPRIWLTAARLEEAHGKAAIVERIVAKAVTSLAQHTTTMDREYWLKEAESCEALDAPATCGAIVRATLGLGVEEEDRKAVWTTDAESALSHGSVATARAIYECCVATFPGKKGLWLRLAHLEKEHGTGATLLDVLARATRACPSSEILWLMRAKETWLMPEAAGGGVDAARAILEDAFKENGNSMQIWLAAAKVEGESGEWERARAVLARARERAPGPPVWLKSAKLERQLAVSRAAGGDDAGAQEATAAERALLDDAVARFPTYERFWMMMGQHLARVGSVAEARAAYQRGLKAVPGSALLWVDAARLEESVSPASARAMLERARKAHPKSADVWNAAIGVEMRAARRAAEDAAATDETSIRAARALVATALRADHCPADGRIWSLAIELEPRAKRKDRSALAVRTCDNDPYVLVTVARWLWAEHRLDRARSWLDRAVTLDGTVGDHWAVYYRFEREHGTPEAAAAVRERCVKAAPRYGELWTSVSKGFDANGVSGETLPVGDVLDRVSAAVEPLK